MKINRKKLDLFFSLNFLKIGLIIVFWFLFVFLHNLIYAVFNFEEGFFLILAVIVVPFYFFISIIYSFVKWSENGGMEKFVRK